MKSIFVNIETRHEEFLTFPSKWADWKKKYMHIKKWWQLSSVNNSNWHNLPSSSRKTRPITFSSPEPSWQVLKNLSRCFLCMTCTKTGLIWRTQFYKVNRPPYLQSKPYSNTSSYHVQRESLNYISLRVAYTHIPRKESLRVAELTAIKFISFFK